MNAIKNFIKHEPVLSAAGLLAIISSFAVPPSAEYAEYINFRVLALLFCLMLVVAGMKSAGVFRWLGTSLLNGAGTTRKLTLVLVSLCFFSSMLITNDVSLITFVPFTITILSMAGRNDLMIPIIVLQTIAANLGSMFTPVGNPQNLFLYSEFSVKISDFLIAMLPLTMISFLLIAAAVFFIKDEKISGNTLEKSSAPPKAQLSGYIVLFCVCIACVCRIISWQLMCIILVAGILVINRSLFAEIDWMLLLTFICFFVFIGNIQQLPSVASLMEQIISGHELMIGILSSQFISNVPAAVLLSGFTDSVRALLFGVNIGGLGTLIASLASIISYRFYAEASTSGTGKYIKVFTLYNLIFLVILTAAAAVLLKI